MNGYDPEGFVTVLENSMLPVELLKQKKIDPLLYEKSRIPKGMRLVVLGIGTGLNHNEEDYLSTAKEEDLYLKHSDMDDVFRTGGVVYQVKFVHPDYDVNVENCFQKRREIDNLESEKLRSHSLLELNDTIDVGISAELQEAVRERIYNGKVVGNEVLMFLRKIQFQLQLLRGNDRGDGDKSDDGSESSRSRSSSGVSSSWSVLSGRSSGVSSSWSVLSGRSSGVSSSWSVISDPNHPHYETYRSSLVELLSKTKLLNTLNKLYLSLLEDLGSVTRLSKALGIENIK